MPEGDNLTRAARQLDPLLRDHPLAWLSVKGVPRRELVGRTVRSVDAHGKNLFIHLAGGVAVHVHLGMHGRIRVLPAADPGLLARSTLGLSLADRPVAVVVSRAPTVRVVRDLGGDAARSVPELGPDPLAASTDVPGMVKRARRQPDRPIGEVLLDQRVSAGIGNVYKSELLYLHGLHPRTPVGRIADEALTTLFTAACKLMGQNLGPWRRTTTADLSRGERIPAGMGRFHVYRARRCPRCRGAIERITQGEQQRSTYFCPRCQPALTGCS